MTKNENAVDLEKEFLSLEEAFKLLGCSQHSLEYWQKSQGRRSSKSVGSSASSARRCWTGSEHSLLNVEVKTMAEKYSYWNNNVNSDDSSNDDFFAGYDEARIPVQVPAGTYVAVLTGWKTDLNKNGNRCVKLSYRIASGDYSGQIVTERRFLTAAAMGYTKKFFDSMGINPRRSVSDYPEIWVELVTTIQDGKDGRQYTNVQWARRIVPPEGQTPAQPSSPAADSSSSSQTPSEQVSGVF